MSVSWSERVRQFKSPLRCVAAFLLRSRATLAARYRALQRRYEELQGQLESQQRAHEQHIERLQQKLDELRASQRERHVGRAACLPEDLSVGSHGYGPRMISLATNLARLVGLRGSERVLHCFFEWMGVQQAIPDSTTIRNWMQRLGIAALKTPFEKADDWILMSDHSNQVGTEHTLLILGLRASNLPAPGTALKHNDVHVLLNKPGTQWKQEDMAKAYGEVVERTGVPRAILVDGAPQLRDGAKNLQKIRSDCVVLRDFKHYAANVLESLVGNNQRFKEFSQRIGKTRSIIQQTELAHLLPPANRLKSRFMNLAPTLHWARVASWLLAHPEAHSRKGLSEVRLNEKLGWLKGFAADLEVWQECQAIISTSLTFVNEQYLHAGATEKLRMAIRSLHHHDTSRELADRLIQFVSDAEQQLKKGERLPLSTEILESTFGLYKQLERQHSKGGFTSLLAALPALLKPTTPDDVIKAFAAVSTKDVQQWVKTNLGTTLKSRRRTLEAEYAKATKSVTNQLIPT